MCVHKQTKEFYIGYRYKNVDKNLTSDQDFPTYKTSSKKIKPIFDMFDWHIVAEFFTDADAYDFEQALIYEHWDNPLLLNQSCHHLRGKFKRGPDWKLSDDARQKLSNAHKGRVFSEEWKQGQRERMSGKNNPMYGKPSPFKGKQHTLESKAKLSEAAKNRPPISEETRQKLSRASKGNILSDYQRQRIRESNSTRVVSDETKRKISEAAKKRWKKSIV
jgi:hypothetical protein